MKNLISQEEKNIIDDLCKQYNITEYSINPDGSIDVDGNVYLNRHNYDKIPLKFGKVTGNFNCVSNKLTSLEHCPSKVGGSFYCAMNKLTSLEHCPTEVGGDFICTYNILTSLEHCPSEVGGDFDCTKNQLTSLEGCPTIVGGVFDCGNNKLTSLVRCPSEVGGSFFCNENQITSLEHCPTVVGGDFYYTNNNLPREFTWVFGGLRTEEQRIFLKYQDQMGVWYNGYDHEAAVELIEEIMTGLL
jgi:hypothetical protein